MNSHQRRVARRARRRATQSGTEAVVEMRVTKGRSAQARFDRLLSAHHELGATPPVGDFLRQEAWMGGERVALLVWGSAALSLKDREAWIGWTPRMKRERLKLVVQNRRFC